jgi:predicted PurR-regulated permease PerM
MRLPFGRKAPEDRTEAATVVQIDASALSRVFSAPMWLRDLGLLAWFLVGVGLVLAGAIWLMAVTWVILGPVLVGAILATVTGPLVTRMHKRGIGRAAGAAIVLIGMIVIGIAITLIVFGGLYRYADQIKSDLSQSVDKIEGWANDHGITGTSSSTESAKSSATDAGRSLLQGLRAGIQGLTSFIFFITFSVFSTFFLLKDGPTVRRFIDRSLGVPVAVATTITGNVVTSLRNYFLGVTIVAGFNAAVVGLGALVLGVPLPGTIAVLTFVLAYIPYLGAFVAGAFAVLLALTESPTDAVIMLVIVILANGMLQNLIQPIAFGATLDLSPLVALIASVGAGAIFGMPGLVLGAPLTSAAVHISRDLAAAKAKLASEDAERGPPSDPEPATTA